MWRAFGDLLFVPHCPACDTAAPGVGSRRGLCSVCSESLYELGAACPRCAEPIAGPVAISCAACRRRPPPFESVCAPFRYGGELAVALQRLKYQRRPDIARALAPILAPVLRRVAGAADTVVPVPLHWRRFAARGFNQAALLARHGMRGMAVPIDVLSLGRVRATRPQSGASAGERTANVAGAFAVARRRRGRIRGKRVLLVDDIVTTGATAAAASRALLEAGARSVVVFCAARVEA